MLGCLWSWCLIALTKAVRRLPEQVFALLVTGYQRDGGGGGEVRGGGKGTGKSRISLGLVGAKHKEGSNIKFTLLQK